jgi:RNA-directed DNA polymerase
MTHSHTTTVRDSQTEWAGLNWPKLERIVSRAQVRIARAAQNGDWKKVTELQRMIVNSFAAKVIAVRDVTSSSGARTPGVDGEIWDTPKKKMTGALSLTKKNYRPKPLRRVYIDKGKGDGSKRPLGIPTIRDRAMQKLYALALDPVAEVTADKRSFGFRKGRSAKDAREYIFDIMASRIRAQWVLEADIKGFFDHISHQWMVDNIPMDKEILRKFLKAGFVDGNHLYPTEEGTPQGGVISPILANMTLDGLEQVLQEYRRHNPTAKVNLARYADDFIITGATKEICEEVKKLIQPFLTERGVELSAEKTAITHIDDGFDFLGWNFRKYGGKLLIKPSKKSQQKLLRKVRRIVKDNPTMSQRELIRRLNPILRGWRNYHNNTVAKKVFAYIDNAIFEALWLWARRRHKRKGKRWIRRRYWHTIGSDNWVFYDNTAEIGKRNQRLIRLTYSPIIRHPSLKLDMNPYLDKEYFEKRALILGARRLTGDFQRIWARQKGICPFCKKPILDHVEAEVHHVWPRQWGGSRSVTNLVYLHIGCHKTYHMRYPIRQTATREEKLDYTPIVKLGSREYAIQQMLEKPSA